MLASQPACAAQRMTHESLIEEVAVDQSVDQSNSLSVKIDQKLVHEQVPNKADDPQPNEASTKTARAQAVASCSSSATSYSSYSSSSSSSSQHQISTDPTSLSSPSRAASHPASITTPACQQDDTTVNTSDLAQADGSIQQACADRLLDDEIKSRLDRLNALSDLINSLELQFDEANSVFRNTLKCSTDRLSTIARTLGDKSIKYGRVYHAAKISVEQSQSDCQRACVLFEQANKDHQFARKAIKDAELKLRKVAGSTEKGVITLSDLHATTNSIDLSKLTLKEAPSPAGRLQNSASASDLLSTSCDMPEATNSIKTINSESLNRLDSRGRQLNDRDKFQVTESDLKPEPGANSVAELSEELNQAINKLVEAENKRGQSERQHLDNANKLIVAQENLMKLEREYGNSIRRSQLYFDEAKRFNAKLNSVKGDICRISEDIIAAKQAYARTLEDLEQFSDGLHMRALADKAKFQ